MTESATPAEPNFEPEYCPFFQHAVELIGRRWTGSILKALGKQPLRFTEIRSAIPGLSDRLLDTRLSELEDEDVVERCETPGEVRYGLSEKGRALQPVFDAIGSWSYAYRESEPEATPGRRRC